MEHAVALVRVVGVRHQLRCFQLMPLTFGFPLFSEAIQAVSRQSQPERLSRKATILAPGPRCGSVGMYVLGPACHEIIDPPHFSLVTWQTECRTCQVY